MPVNQTKSNMAWRYFVTPHNREIMRATFRTASTADWRSGDARSTTGRSRLPPAITCCSASADTCVCSYLYGWASAESLPGQQTWTHGPARTGCKRAWHGTALAAGRANVSLTARRRLRSRQAPPKMGGPVPGSHRWLPRLFFVFFSCLFLLFLFMFELLIYILQKK